MAAWTEYQRMSVARWLGYGAVFRQADPRLDAALNSILATSDGGTRPDNSAQLMITGWLKQLDGQPGAGQDPTATSIEGRIIALRVQAQVGTADEVKIDPFRGMKHIQKEGRFYVRAIYRMLGFTSPLYDVFSDASGPNESGEDNMRQPPNW